jgi:hypothetical protein
MTERGLPSIDGPVACPFVAFADDRDGRSSSPDHRHRCYAEATPAPRALAHQEAYCLASAFPVCPTFQDWARREAAPARTADAAPAGQAIPGLADERPSGDLDADEEPIYEDRPRRNTQRNWAAPPPWINRAAEADPHGTHRPDEEDDAADATFGGAAAAGAAGGGLSGSFADRLVTPAEPPRQRKPVWRDDDKWDDEIGDEPEGGDADAGLAAGAMAAAAPELDQPPPRRSRERSQAPARDREDTGRHEVGPSWERPARLEAFPSLRSQRMPSISLPTLAVAAIAVVLAAILLFFLPGLLGLGSNQPAASATPTSAAATAAPSVEVTPEPAATQQVYTVQSGDTMSKIAGRFKVPLQTLIDANPQIKNPDRLNIGDQLFIPVPGASVAPGTSAAP